MASGCVSCGTELPAAAKFCPSCGTPVGSASPAVSEPEPASLAPGEERKVITVLFADLVGFTSHTEASDPEEVKQSLVRYHRLMREHVERFGGRVEKLMGDGVFAVFGVPAAHEDDPERAVRAALRFQAEEDLGLDVRIAVTTGEAVVQIDRTDPDREGIIGDVVNTASRLEGHAPAGGVVVDERTYRSTNALFEYRPLPAVDLKGKVGLTSIWQADASKTRYGVDVEAGSATPFVGRAHELAIVERSFERAISDRSLQLVTISGEPGSGKSRLLDEFLRVVDNRPDLVWWRQGRCLPYGDGISFWALGEIVKAQGGILESDDPVQARGKLAGAVANLIDDPRQADWVVTCLVPLAGVGPAPAGVERSELFRGWLRFIEALAAVRPLVMVVEDLHWADDALVEFLGFLVRRAVDSPILLLVSARPELFVDHPDWGAGLRNATSVSLAPLDDADAALLLAALLPGRLMTAEAQESLLERCGGNPLHVLEFVRLATEQGRLDELGTGAVPVPDSVHAVVAARLDLLTPELKTVLQTAAVMGKTFWDGALSFVLPVSRGEVTTALESLAGRDLVRPLRQSSMSGEEEWAFTHSMIRDVAYGQLPRGDRRLRHQAVARWMEAVAGDRAVDVAEVLAHHYSVALEGLDDPPKDLSERAYAALMQAGLRAEALNVERSFTYYDLAASLASSDRDRGRAHLNAAELHYKTEPVRQAARDALEAFEAADDLDGQALATQLMGRLQWFDGDGVGADRLAEQAVRLAEELPDGLTKAKIYVQKARSTWIAGRQEEAWDWFDRARPVVDAYGDVSARTDLLLAEGGLRMEQGDLEGMELSKRALRLAEDRGLTGQVGSASNNLATFQVMHGDLEVAHDTITRFIEIALERGQVTGAFFSRMTRLEALVPLGRWDEAEAEVAAVLADVEASGEQGKVGARGWQATMDHFRGRDVSGEANELLEAGLRIGDPQMVAPLAACALAALAAGGQLGAARHAADVLADVPDSQMGSRFLVFAAPWMAAVDRLDQFEKLIRPVPRGWVFLEACDQLNKGVLAQGRGDDDRAISSLRDACEALDRIGARLEATIARPHLASALERSGRTEESEAVRARARSDAAALGASRILDWLDEGIPLAAAG